jgi:hypothetical protein
MNTSQHLSVEDASRLAVTATAVDLEGWARIVAVNARIDLHDLIDVLDLLRAASAPQHTESTFPTLAAS